MKIFSNWLVCIIAVMAMITASSYHSDAAKFKNETRTECSVNKSSDDLGMVFLIPTFVESPKNSFCYIETSNGKDVKQFDLITHPLYGKNLTFVFESNI